MYRIFLSLFIVAGCKALVLSDELNDRETNKLFLQAKKSQGEYSVWYNADSTYALCIANDQSEILQEPISFFIINIRAKEKVLISINEYHKAQWLDHENLLFKVYSGAPNSGRNMNKMPGSGIRKYIFNVTSKQIRPREPESADTK